MSEWSKKRKVMKYYDRIARIYEKQYSEEQQAKINAILADMTLDRKSLVLDAGCGTGILFTAVAKAQSVIGVDTSSNLLQKAKQYIRKFSNIHIIRADSDHLPLQDNVFNMVFAVTLLQNTPKPAATLEEIKRVSKSKAFIALTALKKELSEENFIKHLKNAQLAILTIKTDEKLKDHIAICKSTK